MGDQQARRPVPGGGRTTHHDVEPEDQRSAKSVAEGR